MFAGKFGEHKPFQDFPGKFYMLNMSREMLNLASLQKNMFNISPVSSFCLKIMLQTGFLENVEHVGHILPGLLAQLSMESPTSSICSTFQGECWTLHLSNTNMFNTSPVSSRSFEKRARTREMLNMLVFAFPVLWPKFCPESPTSSTCSTFQGKCWTLRLSNNMFNIPQFGLVLVNMYQKNPRVRKIRVRNSGAGNGCANFMDTWKKCVLSAGKTMSVKFLFFLGGGGPILFLWARGFFWMYSNRNTGNVELRGLHRVLLRKINRIHHDNGLLSEVSGFSFHAPDCRNRAMFIEVTRGENVLPQNLGLTKFPILILLGFYIILGGMSAQKLEGWAIYIHIHIYIYT